MDIEHWWGRLDTTTRHWLIAHNGEPVPGDVVDVIVAAGGPAASDAWWSHEDGPRSFSFPDDAVDQVETIANDEAP
ncbi:hypothetical protein [Amnibacterium kyonggiense]|uniref:Uncharacterized protein n=1 Tax=Amnibacterium kyonggiense TaxID=595671 RepID=A0A4R7FRL5_9MICO|nr:hypothetical protein [Amnibacterium kyonggiense]TDS80289.1 hypothetical protein CLV52_0846 [Amnibacterium kyonggiense]